MSIVYFNGHFLPEKEAFLQADSRAFLLGDGVYTTLLLEDGKLFFFPDHMQRLQAHGAYVNIFIPKLEKNIFEELVKKNHAFSGTFRIRISVAREKIFSSMLEKSVNPHVLISIYPEKIPKERLSLCVWKDPFLTPLSKLKVLSQLPRLFIKNASLSRGFDDALTLGIYGEVLEASFANVFWVLDDCLYYPDPSLPYLFGITLQYVLKAASNLGISLKEVSMRFEEIPENAHIFVCSSVQGVLPVQKIEYKTFTINDLLLSKLLAEWKSLANEHALFLK
jgi:4-amino-4-deoxychorismate lyase